MTFDLAIIGAGIGGSCLARAARAAGLNTVVIADPAQPPASLAAICVLRRAWRTAEERPLFDRSLAWYREHGWVVTERAEVLDSKGAMTIRPDWTLVDPIAPLVEPDLKQAISVEEARSLARAVVRCTAFGGPYEPAPLAGATALLPAAAMPEGLPLKVAILGPYRCVQAAKVGDVVKIGSSKAKDKLTAVARCAKLVSDAADKGIIDARLASQVTYSTGVRAVLPKATPGRTPYYWASDSGGWWMGGFARVGYSLAPAIAEDVLSDVIRSVS